MENPINTINNTEIINSNPINSGNMSEKNGSNIAVATKSHEHPAIFLMRKLSEAVMEIYNDMGLGQHIDFDI